MKIVESIIPGLVSLILLSTESIAQTWVLKAPHKKPRTEFSAAASGTSIYVAGKRILHSDAF